MILYLPLVKYFNESLRWKVKTSGSLKLTEMQKNSNKISDHFITRIQNINGFIPFVNLELIRTE